MRHGLDFFIVSPGTVAVDVLSAVLRELRLESVAYRFLELSAPWRLRFDGDLRGVHLIVAGRCTLTLEGEPPLGLTDGDLVVLPRADNHELISAGGESAVPVSSLALASATAGKQLVAGGTGERTRVICGAFFFGDQAHPAISGLPRRIHVAGNGVAAPGWLPGLSEALAEEAGNGGPGSEVVMARLSEALIIRALRHHVETGSEPGWLHGLADPQLARALDALHGDLAEPWTVASLARTAGLSRSAFAGRFAATVGQTPMQYLYQCRMRRAMHLLRAGQATAGRVAGSVGYGSEAAFSAAFSRYAGITPGAYRRSPAGELTDEHRP